jgi:hypothetical protein
MTFVLFIAVIALGWLVVDTRRRLDTVERQLAQRAEPDVIDALSWPEPKPETMVAPAQQFDASPQMAPPPPAPTIKPLAEPLAASDPFMRRGHHPRSASISRMCSAASCRSGRAG